VTLRSGRTGVRRSLPNRAGIVLVLGAIVLSATVVAACTPTDAPSGVSPPAEAVLPTPLESSTAGPGTSWVVMPMGHLDDPTNTFWQMFYRSGTSSRWELATPPGVASNGGLVATIGSSGTVTAGFEPSQGLLFSPLAQTADLGATWSQGLLPGGLAPVPDALASSGAHQFLALLRDDGGRVVTDGGGLTTWTTVTSARKLASYPSSARCGITGLSAVTHGTDGDPVVGTACAHGSRPGIFESSDGSWHSVGPPLPDTVSGPTRVIRLLDTPAGVTALVSAGKGTPHSLFALWSADGSTWTVSAPLRLPAGPSSTGVTATGGLVVVTGGAGGRRTASIVDPSGGRWDVLPTPPGGTSAVVDGPDGTIEALIADQSTLHVDALDSDGWHRVQTSGVAIQYGSSS